MAKQLIHEALAEFHHFVIRFPLGIEIGTTFTGTDGQSGKAVFENFEIDIYTIQVTKDNLSNIIDKDNSGKGFVAIGIFQNQAEINAYTDLFGDLLQPDANPGDLKIDDLNNDYKIDDKDRVSETFYIPYVDVNGDLIIDEFDKVIINKEGELGYQIKENLDMDTYIGR